MNDFWKKATCACTNITPADSEGQGICTNCGSLHQLRLTRSVLERGFEAIRRDFGPYGRHSMRCVDTGEGWVCAPDCTIAAPPEQK